MAGVRIGPKEKQWVCGLTWMATKSGSRGLSSAGLRRSTSHGNRQCTGSSSYVHLRNDYLTDVLGWRCQVCPGLLAFSRNRRLRKAHHNVQFLENANTCRLKPLDILYPYGYRDGMFTVRQTEAFVAWLDALKDKRAQVRIAARLRQAEAGSLGDWQPIEGEVSEMRVHYGPGYRLYFVRRGRVIVVMLNAGDKSTQKRDIRHALKLASELGDDL